MQCRWPCCGAAGCLATASWLVLVEETLEVSTRACQVALACQPPAPQQGHLYLSSVYWSVVSVNVTMLCIRHDRLQALQYSGVATA